MKKTRVLSLALVVLMVCGLGACTKASNPGASETSTNAGAASPSTSAAVTTGVELNVWAPLRTTVSSLEDNRFTDWYEKQTGIHINWTTYVDDLPTQFNLSIASGDFPDVYINYKFSPAQIQQAVEAGAAIPMNPYLADYAPNYSRLLELDPELKKQVSAPDGSIYSFADYRAFNNNYGTSHKLWIYEPWLKDSGLPMPTTLDELEQVMIYFRDHDMNGNGDTTDEWPMMGSSMILSNASDPLINIIDCFEVVTDNWLRADESKKITTMATTDNYRAGLSYANKLYKEGLVAPETYTQNINTFRTVTSVASDDQVVVGVTGGPDFARFVTATYVNAYKNYTPVPPLKKDNNSQPQTILQPSSCTMQTLITPVCKYPEAAIKWLDGGFEPLNQITSAFGFEGEHWTRISESPETGIVFELTDKSIYETGASTQNTTWSPDWLEFPTYQGDLYRAFTQKFKEGTNDYIRETKQQAANKAYQAVAKPDGLPHGNLWDVDEALQNEVTELGTNITNYITTSYAEFISGTRDVNDDATWQAYKDELDNMGLDRYIELSEQLSFGK